MGYKTRFYLVREKAQKKNFPVRFSFTFDSERYQSTTGLKADTLDQWSETKQQFKSSASNSEAKNEQLHEITKKLEKIYLDCINKGITPTIEHMKTAYRKQGQPLTFFDYFNEFVITEGKTKAWSMATYAKFKTLKMHLEKFEKKGNPLLFSIVDRDFYQRLFDYFVSLGHRNSSIKKSFRNVNWFLNWCVKAKDITINKIGDFELKDGYPTKNPESVVFLHPQEFITMYEAIIPDLRLSRAKDVFAFLCSTGLRFSDYQQLTPEHITKDSIILTTIKTGDAIEQPLNPFSKAILEKYNNNLPKYSNPVLNRFIKDFAEVLQLDRQVTRVYVQGGRQVRETKKLYQVLSTHSGRRTFVSLSIALNMNTEVLQRFTGHTTNEMLKVYTGIGKDQKVREMSLFNPENIKSKIAN